LLTFSLAPSALAADAFNPSALRVASRYAGPDGGWDYARFDPVHHRLYVARTDGVTAVDVSTGKVTPQLVAGSSTHTALPVNDGKEILVTDRGSGGVFIADALTGAVRAKIATGSGPDGAFVEPTTGLVWVMDGRGAGITIVDAKTGATAGHIAYETGLEAPVGDKAGKVFVTIEDKNEIAVFDVKTRSLVKSYPLAGCEGPTGIAYDAADHRLVAECANGVAKIVSADDGHELASLPIGQRPDGLVTDERRNLVFAPTGGDAQMTVIDPAKMAVVGTVATETGARSGAIDPETGVVYLPSGKFAPPPAGGGRPTLVPGSFEVLAVATR
jgi:YVTN family beta-propeller protein